MSATSSSSPNPNPLQTINLTKPTAAYLIRVITTFTIPFFSIDLRDGFRSRSWYQSRDRSNIDTPRTARRSHRIIRSPPALSPFPSTSRVLVRRARGTRVHLHTYVPYVYRRNGAYAWRQQRKKVRDTGVERGEAIASLLLPLCPPLSLPE